MTDGQARGVLGFAMLTLAAGGLLLAHACGLELASGPAGAGCSPAARETVATWAENADGPLHLGCGVLESDVGGLWVTIVCDSLESADALLEKLPEAQVVARGTMAPLDGGAPRQVVRLRVLRASLARLQDGGFGE